MLIPTTLNNIHSPSIFMAHTINFTRVFKKFQLKDLIMQSIDLFKSIDFMQIISKYIDRYRYLKNVIMHFYGVTSTMSIAGKL